MVRELLGVVGDLDILRAVRGTEGEVPSVRAWLEVLPDPRVLACRDRDTGTRHVEIRSGHSSPPVREAITVYWRCQAKHPLWARLFTGVDLAPGAECEVDPGEALKATSHLQIVPAAFG